MISVPVMAQGDMSPEEVMATAMQMGTPGEQHADLAKHAGAWKVAVKMWMDPTGQPIESSASVNREMILDGRVQKEDFQGNMMGQPFSGLGLTGYDNVTKRYWSIWMDSTSTGTTLSWGTWNEEAQAIVYHGESPDPMTGEMAKTKILIRQEEGKEHMEMYGMMGDQEVKWLEMEYVRE
ncbi:MAG: DUF1579 family protein [Acidobacteriota bacterium]